MNKDLKEKAIKIKGKDYVQVADRVIYFNETYKNGCIQTKELETEAGEVKILAKVIPDVSTPDRYFTGHAQEKWDDGFINKTSALENAETSAVGRALAMMGIGVIDNIASVDEVNKATNRQKTTQVKEDPFEGLEHKYKCEDCANDIPDKVRDFSIRMFKKPLCMKCQNKYKK